MTGQAGVSPMRALGRVVRATEAALYSNAVELRTMLQQANESLQQELQHHAATELDSRRLELEKTATSDRIRTETEFSARTSRQLADLEHDIRSAIAEGLAHIVGNLNADDGVAAAARLAVTTLQDCVGLTLRVAPERVPAVRAVLEAAGQAITIVADQAMDSTGCLLETDGGTIQISLDQQMEILRQAFATADCA